MFISRKIDCLCILAPNNNNDEGWGLRRISSQAGMFFSNQYSFANEYISSSSMVTTTITHSNANHEDGPPSIEGFFLIISSFF